MRKIIYLIDQPFDAWNRDRFGIQTWVDRGWEVEVWDVTPLVYPRIWARFRNGGLQAPLAEHFPIDSLGTYRSRIAAARNATHVIDLSGDTTVAALVKVGLARRGVARVTFATGTIPEPSDIAPITFARRVHKACTRPPAQTLTWFDERLGGALVQRFARPSIIVVSGEKSIPAASGAEILRAHNLDYDVFLRLRDQGTPQRRSFAVFIDQDYCFHQDFLAMGSGFWTTPERYFPAICRGLRAAGAALGLDIRVAAHPRATHAVVEASFAGFPVVYGRTAEVIRDCAVVVCHDSTAVQYGVLFEKPMIFFTTDELNASFAGGSIARFAAEVGKTVINVDEALDGLDWQREVVVDRARYEAYRRRYIKTAGSPERSSWEIIAAHLEEADRPGASRSPQGAARHAAHVR